MPANESARKKNRVPRPRAGKKNNDVTTELNGKFDAAMDALDGLNVSLETPLVSSAETAPVTSADVQHQSSISLNQASMGESDICIPDEKQLLESRRLQGLAELLSNSLAALQAKRSRMAQRAQLNTNVKLPFQIRRAGAEKAYLEEEIERTEQTISKLLVMSRQLKQVMQLKRTVFAETQQQLKEEIAALEKEKEEHAEVIREGFVNRINLLHRYWPWRQLRELGDTTVGETFEEELARGPRYRHVGIQNSIQSDYIERQLHWLENLTGREEVFRTHIHRLEGFVEDLTDINDLLESALTCTVCGLLFEKPVLFWPCGHTFCLVCFESLAIAPSLFRCPLCGSINSEGYLHNIILAETVAKWMFKDAGFGDLHVPLSSIRLHLSRFRGDKLEGQLAELRERLREHRTKEQEADMDPNLLTISYRLY